MKSTQIKVVELSNEEMLNHTGKEYNPATWKQRVESMIARGAKFYEAKPDKHYSYSRFFTEYRIPEGLYFLNDFSPYSSSLTSHGFARAYIIDGEIFTKGFGKDGDERVVNTKEGRKWLVENICKHVMVTNCL